MVSRSEWIRRALRVPVLLVGLTALSFHGSASIALASGLFAGINGIEAGLEQPGGVQSLTFRSDLPFQYQTQVLNRNAILLRLYNARLADNLLTLEGSVNLLAGGVIQEARLRTPNAATTQLVSGPFQEIVLSGPGLGEKKLHVVGATEAPLTFSSAAIAATPQKLTPAIDKPLSGAVKPSSTSANTRNSQPRQSRNAKFSNLATLQTHPKSSSAFKKLVQEPVAPIVMAALANETVPLESQQPLIQPSENRPTQTNQSRKAQNTGPQITSVRNVAGPQLASANQPPAQERRTFASLPAVVPPSYRPVQEPAPETHPTVAISTPTAAPEPDYEVVAPLPRYHGGAAPIQAITTDNEGRPILLRPKNQPIAEFEVSNAEGGYNTLFQAESETSAQKVSRLMSGALASYRASQWNQALTQVQQALQLDANNGDLYAALAEIQLQLKQPKLAAQNYRMAAERAQGKYDQRYAQVLVLSGQRQEALNWLKQVYNEKPDQFELAYMLGTLYEEQGETGEALPYLKQAASLHPASADIQYNLGLAYELSGDKLLAEKHYRQALNLNASAQDAKKALARVKEN